MQECVEALIVARRRCHEHHSAELHFAVWRTIARLELMQRRWLYAWWREARSQRLLRLLIRLKRPNRPPGIWDLSPSDAGRGIWDRRPPPLTPPGRWR